MNVTPDTTIRLLKCPLELSNKNQLTFTNLQAQTNYFLSLTHLEIDGSMYQRKDSSIYYPGLFDDLIGYNYVMYQNSNYSNKWFYAFILGMQYLSDNTTKITITTDPWQTWQFDINFMSSFVEREMIAPNSDTPGANLVPENLETGEYKIASTYDVAGLSHYCVWAYSGDQLILNNDIMNPYTADLTSVAGRLYVNGLHTGLTYIVTTSDLAYAQVDTALKLENQSEYVVAHFSVPTLACNGNLTAIGGERYPNIYALAGTATATTKTLTALGTSIDGYTPKNAKVKQYPYVYLGFNPPQGTSKIYRYEDFSNGTPSFKMISEVNPNPSVYIIPQNYRGKSGDCLSDKVSLNGYPQISSRVDVYNSWLAENTGIINVQNQQAQVNYELDVAGQTVGMFTSIGDLALQSASNASQSAEAGEYKTGGMTGSFGGIVGNAIGIGKTEANYNAYIGMVNAQKEKQAMLPDNVTLGGSNATLLGYGLIDDNIFTTYSVKYQFAKRIDDYFSMYGYQTNELKVPNLNNRPKWNYVKTLGANILGNIPQEDLNVIKAIFDNGVTLWHDTAHFLDYSQTNK